MVGCPIFAMTMWFTNTQLYGSPQLLFEAIKDQGFLEFMKAIWGPYLYGTSAAWAIIAVFATTQLILMRILPGNTYHGPATATGHVPTYRANGVSSFVTTLCLFGVSSWGLGLFSPTIIYDNFAGLIGALNCFSWLFCGLLYVKGRIAPSSGDHGYSGNPLFDFYWGTELYPRIAGWDVKQFTNCRFGMMAWPLILLSFAAKQHELYGITDGMLVAVALQLIYITKFFIWETGYLSSLDIMHDRAGFYICWGCLVWVPSIYTSATAFLVHHPVQLGLVSALAIATVGAAAILSNFWADRQRQQARQSGDRYRVWGRPAQLLHVSYTLSCGMNKETVLLTSGWWGVARHFHYVLEIVGSFCWTLPALFIAPTPYFYVVFLTILLVHRSFRDEERCSNKYGSGWQRYKEIVRYRMIPGIF